MKTSNYLIISTSPSTRPARKPRLTARALYRSTRCRYTGKERDSETGLHYYGARYLDSRTGRWLSGDPAVSDYVPSAPVNDEARKQNENLPGMGGVFNYANLHVYHYAGNNPVKYVDPDGKAAIVAVIPFIVKAAPIIKTALIYGAATYCAWQASKAVADFAHSILESEADVSVGQTVPNTENNGEHTADQAAVVELAKGAKNTGISQGDAETLVDWGNEVGLMPPSHGPESHPNRKQPSSQNPHIHVGPVDHIPIIP